MKKSIYIFLIILFISVCGRAKASTVVNTPLEYYFTFVSDVGRNFSDKMSYYEIDNKTAYCIEPGVKLGSDYNSLSDLSNLSSDKKRRLEQLSYYGYGYENHTDIMYYYATQTLIWDELLIDKSGTVISTESFKKGTIIDISSYKEEIEKTINTHNKRISFIGDYSSFLNTITVYNDFTGLLKYYDVIYDNSLFNIKVNKRNISVLPLKYGNHSIELKEKGIYSSNYNIYKDDTYQDFLTIGNIPFDTYKMNINVDGGSLTINKKDKDNDSNLKNSTYEVFDITNNYKVTEITTDENGMGYYINQLGVADYYLQEIKAPDGYLLDDTKYYFSISSDNNEFNIVLYDDPIIENVVIDEIDEVKPKKMNNIIIDDSNNIDDVYDELIIYNVPNTNKVLVFPYILLLIGVLIGKKVIN